MTSRRREPRVEVSLDVKVWGVDKHGKPFVQYARTLNASSMGARLTGLDCVRVGEIIGVQLGEDRSRFKVVWVGRDNTPKAGQVGLSTVEPGKTLFKGQAGKVDTGWSPTVTSAQPVETKTIGARSSAVPPSVAAPGRRKQPRYNCRGGVELRHHENGAPMWANLSDISAAGCYVESSTPLPAGTEVFFQLRITDQVIRGRAVVKTSHHAVGMGLVFRYLSPEDQQQLDFVLGSLAGGQEMQPALKSPADTPPSTLQTAPASAVRPGPSAAAAAPATGGLAGPAGPISAQIMRAISELNDLEQNLVKGKVDPRLLAQFHDALEHTRQTAWTVQQWVDAHATGGDPFAVLPQLEAERMHMFTKLAHNVTADIDASTITEYSEGITGLYESVQTLYRRLRKLLVDGGENEP